MGVLGGNKDMSSLHYSHIPVIINPASGPDRPVLSLLNAVFQEAGLAWDVFVTKKAGDARRFAQQLVDAGEAVVAVYGGDGTIKEAAHSLARSQTQLAIFPGGTGNALAAEIGIPLDLTLAAGLVCGAPAHLRAVDMGELNGQLFVLRATMGFETKLLRSTNRELKDQLGKLAYPAMALQQLETLPLTRYHITLDGQEIVAEGVQCTVANCAQMGMGGLALAQGSDVSDGRLDVIVLRKMDLAALASIAFSNVMGEDVSGEIQHWQGHEIAIVAEPPEAVAFGADIVAQTPVTIRVIPGALQVVTPDEPEESLRLQAPIPL
jgi:diacylglycerol kinase (ATP)